MRKTAAGSPKPVSRLQTAGLGFVGSIKYEGLFIVITSAFAFVALVGGVGLFFWGNRFASYRRTTILLFGLIAFIVAMSAVFLMNRLTGSDLLLLALLTVLAAMNGFENEVQTRIAGTDAHVVLLGADTAGLRASSDAIEQEGVRRARARADEADLRLLVLDATSDWQADRAMLTRQTARWDAEYDIVVVNKTDLKPAEAEGIAPLSATSGAGLPELLARLERSAAALMAEGGAPPLTRARHREALLDAHVALGRALAAPEVALAAEDLRLAMRALGRITGTVRIDELLDVIFRDFCIGK